MRFILLFSFLLLPSLTCAQWIQTIHVDRGWNLISIPLKVSDRSKYTLFPTSVSAAYSYQDEYNDEDTLDNGFGYWLKFDSSETIAFAGETIHRDTVNVNEGWNMIGSITEIIHADMLTTVPPEIIVSDFFEYIPGSGYKSSDTIKPGTGYWIKINQRGSIIISSGPSCPGIPTVNYSGRTYNTVMVGSQCWLKENLNVGTMIRGIDTAKDNGTIEKYCYNDDSTNCYEYGGFYSWDEAMQYEVRENVQGICPPEWHIPSLTEYKILSTTLGNESNALKAIGQGTGIGTGTNISGFSALLTGHPNIDGEFRGLGYYTDFWSSTECYWNSSFFIGLNYGNNDLYFDYIYKIFGFSVRCILNKSTLPIPCPGISEVEYAGKIYQTVQIGKQCWLNENLNVGIMIDKMDNAANNGIIEKYCWDNEISNCEIYGGLYQWKEAMQYDTSEGIRGICPPGWHIPTYAEFQICSTAVYGDANALKALGQGTGHGSGTNSSGFSALLCGERGSGGFFNWDYGFFYSSTSSADIMMGIMLNYHDNIIRLEKSYWTIGQSIRCIKD